MMSREQRQSLKLKSTILSTIVVQMGLLGVRNLYEKPKCKTDLYSIPFHEKLCVHARGTSQPR